MKRILVRRIRLPVLVSFSLSGLPTIQLAKCNELVAIKLDNF
jgi:hypothetical protein